MLEHVKRDLHVSRVEPWDIQYWLHLQEQSVADAYPREPGVKRLLDLSRALGFAADSLPIDVTVWDVPTGGITFPVRPPFESRLLTNPFTGADFYETLFHEYGHCLNAVLTRPSLPLVFLQGDETPLSEGLAETLGHFAYDRYWIARAANLSFEKAAALERVGKLRLLLWLRRSIALNAWVEIHSYPNLHADLDRLYRESYQRFVGVTLPAGDYFGTKDDFATGPLYYQSYLYANMIAAQLREAMRLQFAVPDLSEEPRVAGWLTQYFFGPGGSIPWQEKIRRATGRPLSMDALIAYLSVSWE
jgi:hypothetical protein